MKYTYQDIQYWIDDFEKCIDDINFLVSKDRIDNLISDTLIGAFKEAIFLACCVRSEMYVELSEQVLTPGEAQRHAKRFSRNPQRYGNMHKEQA